MSDDPVVGQPWEDEEDETSRPLGARCPPAARPPPIGVSDLTRAALEAQDAVARIEASAAAASAPIVAGLRRRIALWEASGWLWHRGHAAHPNDLALREAGVTGSYVAAMAAGRLRAAMPWTGSRHDGGAPPADDDVATALRVGRLWRRLGEASHRPAIRAPDDVASVLAEIGSTPAPGQAEQWLAGLDRGAPAMLAVAWAAAGWEASGPPDAGQPDGPMLAACLWRERGFGRPIALPFWSASGNADRLAPLAGDAYAAAFLGVVTQAARRAATELTRLLAIERAAGGRCGAPRRGSHMAGLLTLLIEHPILTPRTAGRALGVSQQAALRLLRAAESGGLAQEATGRRAFRAYIASLRADRRTAP